MRVAWTARILNQSILKEINPEYSLEGLTVKLKLWYFGYLMQRAAPPSHAHGDLTSLAPHERLPEILVVPREKTPTGAAARGNP